MTPYNTNKLAKSLDKIASRIGGIGSSAVFQHALHQRDNSTGVRIFSIKTPQGTSSKPRFVEKVTSRRNEWRLAKLLANSDSRDLARYGIPIPRVYKVKKLDKNTRLIFQEFTFGTNQKHEWTSELAEALARGAYDFSNGIALLYHEKGKQVKKAKLLSSCHRRFIEEAVGSSQATEFFEKAALIERFLHDSPRIVCHNDIHSGNFSLIQNGNCLPSVTFVDLGMIGMNYVGLNGIILPRATRKIQNQELSLSNLHRQQPICMASQFVKSEPHLSFMQPIEPSGGMPAMAISCLILP